MHTTRCPMAKRGGACPQYSHIYRHGVNADDWWAPQTNLVTGHFSPGSSASKSDRNMGSCGSQEKDSEAMHMPCLCAKSWCRLTPTCCGARLLPRYELGQANCFKSRTSFAPFGPKPRFSRTDDTITNPRFPRRQTTPEPTTSEAPVLTLIPVHRLAPDTPLTFCLAFDTWPLTGG